MIKVAINGAQGRVGQAILEALADFSKLSLAAAYVSTNSTVLGTPVGQYQSVLYSDSQVSIPTILMCLLIFRWLQQLSML